MTKFFAVKTTANQEKLVASLIEMSARKNKYNIYSILAPKELRGYVILESESIEEVSKAVRGIPHVRGVVRGDVSFGEIEHFLTPRRAVEQIKEGYTVEIMSGPFKGEVAIVKRVDEAKNEVTVELLEAVVPIPITVKADRVRVLEKRGEE